MPWGVGVAAGPVRGGFLLVPLLLFLVYYLALLARRVAALLLNEVGREGDMGMGMRMGMEMTCHCAPVR